MPLWHADSLRPLRTSHPETVSQTNPGKSLLPCDSFRFGYTHPLLNNTLDGLVPFPKHINIHISPSPKTTLTTHASPNNGVSFSSEGNQAK